jgi:integrase
MGRKRTPGLYQRNGTWHIDKVICGKRVCESTETGNLAEAESYLTHRAKEIQNAAVYGIRLTRTFREAAIKYLREATKDTIGDDASRLKLLDKFIGNLSIDKICMGTLQPLMNYLKSLGRKANTINHYLKVVRRITRLAANEWQDEYGLSWLLQAPKINLLPKTDAKPAAPLDWVEQDRLFNLLPPSRARAALFTVNVGCRPDKETCGLRWEWERKIPEINTSVFIVPAKYYKNKQERLIVLNDIAKSIIEDVRGEHPVYVFTQNGKKMSRLLTSSWIRARKKLGLSDVRCHDLKHTCGRRLRAAGVSFEDRQDILGHKSGRMTTHYSPAEIGKLIEAANKLCVTTKSTPTLTVIKKVVNS